MADESCGQALETEEVDRRTSHEGNHSRTDYTEVRRRATAVICMRARRRSRTLVGPARLTVNPQACRRHRDHCRLLPADYYVAFPINSEN